LDGLDLFAGEQSVTRGFSLDLKSLSTIMIYYIIMGGYPTIQLYTFTFNHRPGGEKMKSSPPQPILLLAIFCVLHHVGALVKESMDWSRMKNRI